MKKHDLLHYYNQELSYLRDQGQRFAQSHPKIASRLRLGAGQVEDPLVGRLMESFAFLSARVQQNIDLNTQYITQALLNQLYPQYQLPIPAMSTLQIEADPDLENSTIIPAQTKLVAHTTDNKPCYFQTTYPVTLHPIKIKQARYSQNHQRQPTHHRKQLKSSLSLTLETTHNSFQLHQLSGQTLRLFINAPLPQAHQILELLANSLHHIVLAQSKASDKVIELSKDALKLVGFGVDQSVLPYPKHSAQSYRLLTEFFRLPEKFLYIDLQLPEHLPKDFTHTLQCHCYCEHIQHDLEALIKPETFALHCTPIINLFEQTGEPIQFNQKQTDYHVIADNQRDIADIEIYEIRSISAQSAQHTNPIMCLPYFGVKHQLNTEKNYLYWQDNLMPCDRLGLYHIAGHERFVHLSQLGEKSESKTGFDTLILTPKLLCTNRDLPSKLPMGHHQPNVEFYRHTQDGVAAMYCLTPISQTHHRKLNEQSDIDLIAHLQLNIMNFSDTATALSMLKNALALYHYDDQHDSKLIQDALVKLDAQPALARHPDPLKPSLCHGMHLTLTLDETHLPDNNAYLLGKVIHKFLSDSCAINSFVSLTLVSEQRGKLCHWDAALGTREAL